MEQKKTKTPQSFESYDSLPALAAALNRSEMEPIERYTIILGFLRAKAFRIGTPLTGTFELTPLCTLSCKMCYVQLTPKQMGERKLLPVETWISLIDQAVDAGMLFTRLTGGECLTYPGFREVYRHAKARGTEVSVLTNGTLLTEDTVRFFKDNPSEGLQVSLYGSNEDAYERVTGHRVFSQVIGGLRLAKEAGLRVVVSITPSAFLTDDAINIISLLREMELPYSINAGMFAAREETGRSLADYNVALDDYIKIVKYEAKLRGRSVRPCSEDDFPNQDVTKEGGRTGIKCTSGRIGFSIAWDGMMRGCNVLDAIRVYPLEEGFLPAWRRLNEAARAFRLPEECLACGYDGACRTCLAEHMQGAEEGHANPAVCVWGKRMALEGLFASSAE